MNNYVFDIEVFPNFFSGTFLNPDNENDVKVFVVADKHNNLKELINFLDEEITLIGFNNILYDSVVLHLICTLYEKNPKIKARELNSEIFEFSNNLIKSNLRTFQKPIEVPYKQIDLMKLMAFDKLGVSLKQISINLKWHKVQDLPLPYDHPVKLSDYQLVLDYNLNDVLITLKLYRALSEQLELRQKLSDEYGVDLMSASDSKMADIILENIYCKELNISPKEIKNLRTKRESVRIGDCLGKNIEFKTNILKRIKREIEDKIVHAEDNFKYGKTITFANVKYEMGVGGLHSVDEPRAFNATDIIKIIDLDVSSFYPSIMIINNLYPEHLNPKFVDILKRITKERLEAKKSGNKIKADSLKITINSIFGKLGSDVYWLYDPKQLLSVTVSGQLYLLMLIESLVLSGIEVISANTDGVTCIVPKQLEEKCKEICQWWQEKTKFNLEFTEYLEYYRSDVNNYVTLKTDGKTKEKGRYLKGIDLKKAYRHPIVPKALYNYFINGTPIIDTLQECDSILDFCISQKTGGDFVLEYHKDGNVVSLQKNNRFFISTNGGKLIKRRMSNSTEIGLYVGKLATILNDYDNTIKLEDYNIDYSFYVEEANKYIQEIENNKNQIPFNFVDEPENYVSPESVYEKEREIVFGKIKGIKGVAEKFINTLVEINKQFIGNDFLDLLVYCEENSLISSRFKDLISIGYFKNYGNSKKQLLLFDEFRNGKNKYTRKLSDKSKTKRLEELRIFYDFCNSSDFTIREQIENEVKVFGNVHSTFENLDKRYAHVESIELKYTPKIVAYSLATGKKQDLKISKKIYNDHPVSPGDILYCKSFKKKNNVRKNENGEWEEIPDLYSWWLEVYHRVKEDEELKTVS